MKNPKECGYAIQLYGVAICSIGQLPCAHMGECALDVGDRFARAVLDGLSGEEDDDE